ncbi:MAG: cytochrome c biogenesis protein, partial [Acidimicrobiia bacterium]
AAVAAAIGIVMAYSTPPEALQRSYARIVNIHVPSMWLAFLAFGVTALGSVAWRITRQRRWDRLAAASAEIGVLFTVVGLATGMIWGKPVWGVYFDWADARMASTAVLLLVYVGYLALRRATIDPEKRAARASILGIIAVIQVPLVYFSVNLVRTLHQTQSFRPDGATMHPTMVRALLANVAAFTLVYLALISARMLVARLEAAREVEQMASAGSAVVAPNLNGAVDV